MRSRVIAKLKKLRLEDASTGLVNFLKLENDYLHPMSWLDTMWIVIQVR